MTRSPGVTAIVLAGGRSSRFGSPKLAAQLGGTTLLERAIRAAGSVADEIIVAGAPAPGFAAEDRAPIPIRSVADEEQFAGPLAGLAGALRSAKPGLAIVVGGDMPGLVPAVLGAMLERLATDAGADAVLLANPGADPGPDQVPEPAPRQVLPIALDVAVASDAAQAAVEAGDRSLVRLLGHLRAVEIPAAEWLVLDPAGRTLLDVDRPVDLERIRRELR